MRLVIVTQKVDANDRNLGFFVRWIRALAERAEVTVIANEISPDAWGYVPTDRITLHSLGKEKGVSRITRFFRYLRLLREHLPNSDGVFFHMCPEYVLASHVLPRWFGRKTLLWYVHGTVSWRLRVAALFVDRIFTASPESCRLGSKNVEVVGHGIDVTLPPFDFRKNQKGGVATTTNARPTSHGRSPGGRVAHTNGADSNAEREKGAAGLQLFTVGRIAPVKDVRTIILGFLELQKKFPEATLSIAGEPITEGDRRYEKELRRAFSSRARFLGGVLHDELPRLYAEATAFVHASRTGSMDKAVLEALAAGLPVFTSSEAFPETIPGVRKFRVGDPKDLADRIAQAYENGALGYNAEAVEWVRKNHSLAKLILKILDFYEK